MLTLLGPKTEEDLAKPAKGAKKSENKPPKAREEKTVNGGTHEPAQPGEFIS